MPSQYIAHICSYTSSKSKGACQTLPCQVWRPSKCSVFISLRQAASPSGQTLLLKAARPAAQALLDHIQSMAHGGQVVAPLAACTLPGFLLHAVSSTSRSRGLLHASAGRRYI